MSNVEVSKSYFQCEKHTKTKSIRGSDGSQSKFKPNGPLICSKGSTPRLEILNEASRRSRKEALVERLLEAGEVRCSCLTYRGRIRLLRVAEVP